MIRRLAPLALLVAASSAPAQSAIYGAGLQAWTGCWSAEQSPTAAGVVRLVCVTPTANVNVANVATIDDSIVARETIDATGRPFALEAPGCTGARRAAWSRDSRRLFLRTTGVCQGVPLATSAIFSISTSGEWLEVAGIRSRGSASVRITRFRDAGVPPGLPPDVATSVRRDELARESTRAAFGLPVHLDDVIDALRLADADVVAAWIRERGQRFDVTQRDLAQLDLAGVPPRVTEALTAIADSTAALARAADSSSYAESYAMAQQTSGSSFDDDFVPFSYWGVGFYSPFSSRRGGRPGVPGHGGGTPPGSQGGTVRLGKPHP